MTTEKLSLGVMPRGSFTLAQPSHFEKTGRRVLLTSRLLRRLGPFSSACTAAALAMSFAACRGTHATTPGVGVILPLTGPAASFGRSSENAIRLAIDDLHRSDPGLRFNFFFEDSAADPKTGLSALERLRRLQHCDTFISSVSGVTLTLLPVVTRDHLLLFANAAHPDITKSTGFVFRYSNTVESEAAAIAAFLTNADRHQPFLLAINDDYGRAYASELARLSTEHPSSLHALQTEFYDRTTTDFRSLLARAESTKPDIFVLVGFGPALGLLTKQLRETGYSGTYVASLGFVVTPEALTIGGDAVRGGFFLNYLDTQQTAALELRRRYRDRFAEDPSPSILLDYSIVSVLADVWRNAATTPEAIATNLRTRTTISTPLGTLRIQPDGNIIAPVRIQRVPGTGPIDLWRIE